jgi:hypothetical protein
VKVFLHDVDAKQLAAPRLSRPLLPKLIFGVKFSDRIEIVQKTAAP